MSIVTVNQQSNPAGNALLHVDVSVGRGTEAVLASRAPTPASQVRPSLLAAGSLASPARSVAPFYKVLPASIAGVQAERFAAAARGYAPPRAPAVVEVASRAISTVSASAAKAKASSTSKSSTRKTTAKKTSTPTTSASRELAFLDDKHLSIEDKLFQFMSLMTKKNDQELIDAMKEYEAKKTVASASSSTSGKSGSSGEAKPLVSSGGGGGLFGFLGDALGGIADVVVGGAETLAKDLGGPALASIATAVGMPFLAPAALKIGGDLGAGLVDGIASMAGLSAKPATRSTGSGAKSSSSSNKSSTKSSGASSKAAAADPEEFDEKLEMLKLQRLVEKQNAMFSALTNAMKAMHDMQMTAVQNIR